MTPLPTGDYEKALARARAYTLFASLLSQGLSPDLLPILEMIPELAAVLPGQEEAAENEAQHYRLFSMNVFPYETIFLYPDSMLGTEVTEQVGRFYASAAYTPDSSLNADHISQELGLLVHLCAAEAEAIEDQQPHQAARMRQHQRRFLDAHLLRWLPALCLAIQQQQEAFYSALIDLVLDLASDHREALGDELMLNAEALFSLPELPDLLGNKRTSLKDVAEFLLIPAYSGLYLSRDDIGHLAHKYRLPRGFGSRVLMLTNLLRAAVDHGLLPTLLDEIAAIGRAWADAYTALQSPALKPVRATWLGRLAALDRLLFAMKDAVFALEAEKSEEVEG